MTTRIYQFDGFLLDTATRELRHEDGNSSVLPSRVFDCVLHLIEQRERAVGRDELVAVIWERADVGDNVLAQLMARTRKIFRDTGEEQRIIRTIQGFGYHWIARTSVGDGQESSTTGAVAAEESPYRVAPALPDELPSTPAAAVSNEAPISTAWKLVVLIAVLATLAGAWAHYIYANRAIPTTPPADTIAEDLAALPPLSERPVLVLPARVDPATGEGWLRLGMMALVSERLAGAGVPTVPSDNVVALTRGLDMSTLDTDSYSKLSEAAFANWVIQPNVEEIGNRWRIGLTVVHGKAPIKLSVVAEGEQILETAREAVDRLMVGLGTGRTALPPAVEDDELALVLEQARSEELAGNPELARQILIGAQDRFADASELEYQLAFLEFTAGEIDLAQQRLELLLANESIEKDPVATARVLNTLASVRYQRRDFSDVDRYSRRAIDVLQGHPEGARELGRAWAEQARAASSQGQLDASLVNAAKARVLLTAAGDWLGVARTDLQTGIALSASGRLRESVPMFERAADRFGQFHHAWNEGVARTQLTVVQLSLADPALALLQEGRLGELDSRIDFPAMRAAIKLNRADVLIANGRLAAARQLLMESYRSVIDKDDRLNTYFAHAVAARYFLAADQPALAESEASAALTTIYDPEENPRDVAWTHFLAVQLQATHDLATAIRTRNALDSRVGTDNKGNGRLYVHLADAEIANAQGGIEGTRTAFEAALALSAAAPIDLLRTAKRYVPWLLAHDQTGRAAEVVGLLTDLPYRNFDAALLELRLFQATQQKVASQAALDRAQSLAGERTIPRELLEAEALLPTGRRVP